jgi:hypothetical protein
MTFPMLCGTRWHRRVPFVREARFACPKGVNPSSGSATIFEGHEGVALGDAKRSSRREERYLGENPEQASPHPVTESSEHSTGSGVSQFGRAMTPG